MNQNAIIVATAAPDDLNPNLNLNHYAAAGLRAAAPGRPVLIERYERLETAIAAQKPDILLLLASCFPPAAHYSRLRSLCDRTGACLAFWLWDDPYEFDANIRAAAFADIIFTTDKWSAWHYAATCPVLHLPLAADPTVHFREVTQRGGPDVFFCGAAFENRTQLFADLKPVLDKHRVEILGRNWDTARLPFARNEKIPNADLPRHYNSSCLVINVGRRLNHANDTIRLAPGTPGPRTFEAGMAGAAQAFFVEGLEIEDYYETDKEILLFDTVRDFERLVERVKDEPDFSLSIGRAAQKRSQAEHTYTHRAQFILDRISGLGRAPESIRAAS